MVKHNLQFWRVIPFFNSLKKWNNKEWKWSVGYLSAFCCVYLTKLKGEKKKKKEKKREEKAVTMNLSQAVWEFK